MLRQLYRSFQPEISANIQDRIVNNLNAKTSLSEYGVLFHHSFIDPSHILKQFPNISSNHLDQSCNSTLDLKRKTLANFVEVCKTYAGHPSLEVRGESPSSNIDLGMFDFKDIDKLDPTSPLYLRDCSWLINRVKKLIDHPAYKFAGFNLYAYQNCVTPRCLHIDSSYSRHLKAFIYLTDCLDSDGRYSYVPCSHLHSKYNAFQYSINAAFGSDLGSSNTDATLYSSDRAIQFSAKAGDLLISDQRGVHGDMPCLNNLGGKVVLVLNFKIID